MRFTHLYREVNQVMYESISGYVQHLTSYAQNIPSYAQTISSYAQNIPSYVQNISIYVQTIPSYAEKYNKVSCYLKKNNNYLFSAFKFMITCCRLSLAFFRKITRFLALRKKRDKTNSKIARVATAI